MPPVNPVCPECGISLVGIDPIGHSLVHFPEYLDPAKSSKKARKHQELILKGGVTQAEYEKAKED